MAHFQKDGRNVHGQVLTAVAGKPYQLELWGPLDIRTKPPKELDVAISPPNPSVTIKRGDMVSGRNVSMWQITGLPVGQTLVQAKDGNGQVWTSVTIEIKAASSALASVWVVTRDQLKDAKGVVQAKYPPSPAIIGLIELLKKGTGGALKPGVGLLESAGRSGVLYEHTAGLALDIFRNSNIPSQRLQAHNLIRFFIINRAGLGWRNMFYESWGFGRSGLTIGSPNHNDHIHIDWMDFMLLKFDGSNKLDRKEWTEVTWPPEARIGTSIDTENNISLVNKAWNDTSNPFLTGEEITTLYSNPT